MTKIDSNKSLISIIVPVYNTEKYLEQCLDSVCNQTYQYLEIIVINDGSTDRSDKILEKYTRKDTRIKVITQKNRGLSAARNVGLEYSSGEYIMFLDSDDWIDNTTCDIAIEMIGSTRSDVVFWSYVREYANRSKPVYLFDQKIHIWDEKEIYKLYQQTIGLQREQLHEPQKIDSIITAWGKLYRKEIIGDIRFVNTEEIGTEDALFNIQVFSNVKKAVYIPDILSHYRKTNSESLTRKYKCQLVYQWKELYQRIKQHLDNEKAPLDCYQALNNRIALGLIGLGLNLIEDSRLNINQKRRELKKILYMSHYQKALSFLPLNYLPFYWKLFFICAKQRWIILLLILLMIMNRMRNC
ncbi:glycosyltransferase family 2 protein [Anaerostipes butyraticus]|uniref:glycosyltransferase family 2 protein n=1 Tax=Anaerostipes butyraticus TaxID=645466 RepID=UPI0032085435